MLPLLLPLPLLHCRPRELATHPGIPNHPQPSHTPPLPPPSPLQVFFLADIFGSPVFSFNTTKPVVWFPQANGTNTELTLDITDNQDGTYSYNLYVTGACTAWGPSAWLVSAGRSSPEGAPGHAHATHHGRGHCPPPPHPHYTHTAQPACCSPACPACR